MREIILDTETTGLDLTQDRIVEIGCVELIDHVPTARKLQLYVNPGRAMSFEAQEVHGLSDAFLADKPRFAEVVAAFAEFVGDSPLIAHNADFDIGFLNAEFARLGRAPLERLRVVDSLSLARRRHPAGPNSLDALCSRYGVDTSRRTVHGALLDAELLAEVYIELIGGRQISLMLGDLDSNGAAQAGVLRIYGPRPAPLPLRLSAEENLAHRAFIATLEGTPLWASYGVARGAEPAE